MVSKEVALKINVDDSGQPLHQPRHNAIQCLMRCALEPICKRALVKVSFKDRFQDKLYRSLNDSIFDGRNSEPAGFAIPFRYLDPPILTRSVSSRKKPLSNPLHKLPYALGFDGLKTGLRTNSLRSGLGESRARGADGHHRRFQRRRAPTCSARRTATRGGATRADLRAAMRS